MVRFFSNQPEGTMIRLRQIGLASVALSAVAADCLPILRPEISAQPMPTILAWLALAFPLLVPVSIIDRLPVLHKFARRDLLVGPAIIIALIAFPLLMTLGWVGIAIAGVTTTAALLDHIVVSTARHGIRLLWLWVPVTLVSGIVVVLFNVPLTLEYVFMFWVEILHGLNFVGNPLTVMLVTALPLLIASLAIGGTLIGRAIGEKSTTSLIIFVAALFFAITLPSLGLGPSTLFSGTLLLIAIIISLGIIPLFVLASDADAEAPASEIIIWGFALTLVFILSVLSGAIAFIWITVLLAWIYRHYGIQARFFQIIAIAALTIWAGTETLIGRWQMFEGAHLLHPTLIATFWQEGRVEHLIVSHILVTMALMLIVLGLQRDANEPRKHAILTLLVGLVGSNLLVLIIGLAEGPALHLIAVSGWLAIPFILAEILALLPPSLISYHSRSRVPRGG